MTGSPYGINNQRLFVRGVMIADIRSPLSVLTEAFEMNSLFMAPIIAAPMLAAWMTILTVRSGKAKQKREAAEKAAES